MVSIQILSDHFGILFDPKKFGSDIWLNTKQTNVHFTREDSDVIVCLSKLTAVRINVMQLCSMHVYRSTCVSFHKLSKQN